jgi:hypothetical protein
MPDIFLHYIFSLDQYGYIEENKMRHGYQIDSLPVPGEKVITFYNEENTFYNLAYTKDHDENYILYVNNKLTTFTEKDAFIQVQELLKDYMALLEKSKSINLLGLAGSDRTSNMETLKTGLVRNFGWKEIDNTENTSNTPTIEFSIAKYQQLHNQLVAYSSITGSQVNLTITKMLKGVNTILALEDMLPANVNSKYFSTYTDDKERPHLDYGGAARSIGNVLNSKIENPTKVKFKVFK